MEESQHAVLDELEWVAEDARLQSDERDRGVSDLIELVGAVDGLLQVQSEADATYFIRSVGRPLAPAEQTQVRATLLKAYRFQYVLSGIEQTRFPQILRGLLTEPQFQRVVDALAPLM
jgi:hypothetical protein